MNGRDYAQIALVALLIALLIFLFLISISGCAYVKDDDSEVRQLTVDSDCEKRKVRIDVQFESMGSSNQLKVTK